MILMKKEASFINVTSSVVSLWNIYSALLLIHILSSLFHWWVCNLWVSYWRRNIELLKVMQFRIFLFGFEIFLQTRPQNLKIMHSSAGALLEYSLAFLWLKYFTWFSETENLLDVELLKNHKVSPESLNECYYIHHNKDDKARIIWMVVVIKSIHISDITWIDLTWTINDKIYCVMNIIHSLQ